MKTFRSLIFLGFGFVVLISIVFKAIEIVMLNVYEHAYALGFVLGLSHFILGLTQTKIPKKAVIWSILGLIACVMVNYTLLLAMTTKLSLSASAVLLAFVIGMEVIKKIMPEKTISYPTVRQVVLSPVWGQKKEQQVA